MFARLAVDISSISIDQPYDYLIPAELQQQVYRGRRVVVPFGKANKLTEAIVLDLIETCSVPENKQKSIRLVLDADSSLSDFQIRLAVFMRERYFCTFFDACRCMFPPGSHIDQSGNLAVKSETYLIVSLLQDSIDPTSVHLGKRQKEAVELLLNQGPQPDHVFQSHGISLSTLHSLEKRGVISLSREKKNPLPLKASAGSAVLPELSTQQQNVYNGICNAFSSAPNAFILLKGVTGSGKTSIYLHLIQRALTEGQNAMLLVPEIVLTPQVVAHFSSIFGDNIAVLHSGLTQRQRFNEWERIQHGEARIIIGTRSAIFAPITNLGIIIIDEAQVDSYRSENAPRYNAIEIAKYLCYKNNCGLILGSATPLITDMYQAHDKQMQLFELRERYNNRPLPKVMFADMRAERKRGNNGIISGLLKDELKENIARGEQSILFVNRRGANKLVSCGECGHIHQCPNCSVALTYHSVENRMICHYCGFKKLVPKACPECGGKLLFSGCGTQAVESELKLIFPEVLSLRMDSDTVSQSGSHDRLLSRFTDEKIPILIGTQMITKGLDINGVTLVGIIGADNGLFAGDFRAQENTFSQITQVIGRCGRGDKAGRAVIQTAYPDHPVLQLAADQDYDAFYSHEIRIRQLQSSPPFRDVLSISVHGGKEATVIQCCRSIYQFFSSIPELRAEYEIFGPIPYPIVLVNNRYRYRVNLLGKNTKQLREFIQIAIRGCIQSPEYRGLTVFAENNPLF